jgi:hypothetical protein
VWQDAHAAHASDQGEGQAFSGNGDEHGHGAHGEGGHGGDN